jgi:hypothetical protein
MLLRASAKLTDAYSEMQTIVNNPSDYPIFTSNEDNAEIPYTITHPTPHGPSIGGNINDEYQMFHRSRPSKELIDFFYETDDPRLQVLFEKVETPPTSQTPDKNDYVGVPLCTLSPYEYNGGGDHISRLRIDWFYEDFDTPLRATLITYAEVCFIQAEALQKGKITVTGETAETLYHQGVTAGITYWGINNAQASAYLTHPQVVYDSTLKQLLRQKWAALFIKGAETWFDYRRTNDAIGFNEGILSAEKGTGIAVQNFLPYRYIYPDGERAQNREQYEKAIAIFGLDGINTKMWLMP